MRKRPGHAPTGKNEPRRLRSGRRRVTRKCRSTLARSTHPRVGGTSKQQFLPVASAVNQPVPPSGDERKLPTPGVRSVIAAVEDAAAFGHRCQAEARRLDWNDPSELNVLADGAEWIWNLSRRHFPGAAEVLDIYHGVEHLADGSRQIFGEGTSETTLFTDKGRTRLLADGYAGVVEWAGEIAARLPTNGDGAALGRVLNYFAGHRQRLPYALRLRRGQSIGSGLVEGTIKQLLNRRMKQTGARWKLEHVGPFVELGALVDDPQWHAYWQ